MADSPRKRFQPVAAFVLASPHPKGGDPATAADRETVRRLLTAGLHPEHQPPSAQAVREVPLENGLVVQDRVHALLEAFERGEGDRLVWIIGHAEAALGDVYLRTAERFGRLTLANLWRRLIRAARRRPQDRLVVFMDVCHAAPPQELLPGWPENLVAFAAAKGHQRAKTQGAAGGWFTQTVARLLTEGVATEVTPNDLEKWLLNESDRVGQVDQRPFVRRGDLPDLVLNQRTGRRAEGPLDRYRAWAHQVHSQLVDLFGGRLSEEVYVELSLATTEREGADALRGRQHLVDLLRAGGGFAVLGEPGAGKSTLARHLVCQTAAQPEGPVPVYVPLAAWAGRGDVFDFAEQAVRDRRLKVCRTADGIAEALQAAAWEGQVWLLLDGLDEVGSGALEATRAGIRTALGYGCPVVVLSRPHGYAPLARLREARVDRLDTTRQQALLGKWIPDPERHADAWRQIQASEVLQGLAGYPLLLALMAQAYAHGGALPKSRGALYSRALDALLARAQGADVRADRLSEEERTNARRVLRDLSLSLQRLGGEAWPLPELAVLLRRLEAGDAPGQPGLSDRDTQKEAFAFAGFFWRASAALAAARQAVAAGEPEVFLKRVGRCSGVLADHEGAGAPWRYLHRSLRDALSAERLAAVDVAALAAALPEAAFGRWGETLAQVADAQPDPAALIRAVGAKQPELAGRMLREVDGLVPETALALADELGGDPEVLHHLLRRWPRLAAVLWPRVTADCELETLGWLHYALSAAEWVDDVRFFGPEHADRPQRPLALKFVELPPGTFLMGSPQGVGYASEHPQHAVTLSTFAMGATVVTNAELALLTQAADGIEVSGGPVHPAVNVSWYVARLFARWASQAGPDSYCLPSEAQWEYACRAGSPHKWHHGDDRARVARYGWCRSSRYPMDDRVPQPVADLRPNAWGLYDLHGNVLEWCHDWLGDYSAAPSADPLGPPSGAVRAQRGGGCWSGADACRSAYRDGAPPGARRHAFGFRLVRPAPDAGRRP